MPPVVVLKVSINTVQRDLITVNTRQLIKNSDFLPSRTCLVLQSPSSAEESLVNKLSNCLKEKDRALQVDTISPFSSFVFFAELIL